MNEKPEQSNKALAELGKLAYQDLSARYAKAGNHNRSIDDGDLIDALDAMREPSTWEQPLLQLGCFSVLCRHTQLDDLEPKNLHAQIIDAMRTEHESYAEELPPRIRALLTAYEVALGQYHDLTDRLTTSSLAANKRISELYLKAFAVECSKCGSNDLQPDAAIAGRAVVICKKCLTRICE